MIFIIGLTINKMKNIFNYLFYKLYSAHKKGSMNDIAEFAAAINFGLLIAINFFVVFGFLAKLNVIPFFYSNKYQAGFAVIACIILSIMYFLLNKRYKTIFEIYSQESKKDKLRGNIIVVSYVIVSFLSIFAVAFFRSGKL